MSTAIPRLHLPGAALFDPAVIYHGSRKYRKIAITFDDCWHPEVLEQLSGMLEPYPGFHFTFFAIGEAMDINEAVRPGIWKQLADKGHEIGYHTYHHVDPQVMSLDNLNVDFDQWATTLRRVLGFEPPIHFARPPYDDLSLSFQELCRQRGMVATLYSAGYEASNIDESLRLAAKSLNGDIVQMHTYQDPPHGRYDVDITAKVVPYLAGQGYTLVTMSELYDDILREQSSSDGCDIGVGNALTRTCVD